MTRPGGGAHGGGASHERLAEEARATASALLEWLGTRVDQAAAPGGYGARPAQSPGPCTWCPVCALVAAMRGEQPELTARLAEQASGFMTLLRAMAQAHDAHGHGAHPAHDHPAHAAPGTPGAGTAPAGWPPEWGDPSWSATPSPRRTPAPGPDTTDAGPAAHEAPASPAPGASPRGSGPAAGAPRRTTVRTAAFRPTRATRPDGGPATDVEADAVTGDVSAESAPTAPSAPTATDGVEAAPAASREPRGSRPGPRRAPARTTSPRTAARRPSPRAASMPAPGGAPVPEQAVPEQAVPEQAVPEQAVPEQAVPEQAVPEQAVPEQAPEAPAEQVPATPTPGAGGRPRPPVQPISVRRRPDGP